MVEVSTAPNTVADVERGQAHEKGAPTQAVQSLDDLGLANFLRGEALAEQAASISRGFNPLELDDRGAAAGELEGAGDTLLAQRPPDGYQRARRRGLAGTPGRDGAGYAIEGRTSSAPGRTPPPEPRPEGEVVPGIPSRADVQGLNPSQFTPNHFRDISVAALRMMSKGELREVLRRYNSLCDDWDRLSEGDKKSLTEFSTPDPNALDCKEVLVSKLTGAPIDHPSRWSAQFCRDELCYADIEGMDPKAVGQIRPAAIASMPGSLLAAFDVEQLGMLGKKQVEALTSVQKGHLSQEQRRVIARYLPAEEQDLREVERVAEAKQYREHVRSEYRALLKDVRDSYIGDIEIRDGQPGLKGSLVFKSDRGVSVTIPRENVGYANRVLKGWVRTNEHGVQQYVPGILDYVSKRNGILTQNTREICSELNKLKGIVENEQLSDYEKVEDKVRSLLKERDRHQEDCEVLLRHVLKVGLPFRSLHQGERWTEHFEKYRMSDAAIPLSERIVRDSGDPFKNFDLEGSGPRY